MGDRAAKYRRISEDREGREAGVERQGEDLDELADRLGLTVVADYVDNDLGASTRSKKPRPEYQRLVEAAKAGEFEVILAYTSSRLTRRPLELEGQIELAERYGVRFHYVRSPSFDLNTSAGRRVARILAANDAGESEDIAERVSRAAEQRAVKGLNHGSSRCFGYSRNGMELVPAEAAEVSKAAGNLLAGVPLAGIARDLNARGVVTATGRKWSPGAVRQLLTRPRLAGLAIHRGKVVGEGKWPAILTHEQHHAIVSLVSDPARRTTTGNRAAYLLSGWATCGVCGHTMSSGGVKRSRPAEGRRYVYRCRTGYCVLRSRDWCDQYVTDVIIERLARPDAAALLVDPTRPDFDALDREQVALQERLDQLAADFADLLIDRSQLRAGTERIRRRLDEIEAALRHTSRAPILAPLINADNVREVWEALDIDRQRAVAQSLMDVKILPGGSGRRDQASIAEYIEVHWKE